MKINITVFCFISKSMLKKLFGKCGLHGSGSGSGQVAGFCEEGNELYINYQLDTLIIVYT